MALAAQFSKELKKLLNRRTAWLHTAIGKKRPGPAPAFTSKKVRPAVEKLASLARRIMLKKRGYAEFKNAYVAKRQWHVKTRGWGISAKRESFKRWYQKNIHGHNCVYVFWAGRKCQYVGRTLRGKGRPSSSFDKFWFASVTRIDIYSVATPSVVPKAECLAIDVFKPLRNEISSSRPKYSKRCPICAAEKQIKRELKSVFPLLKKKRTR